MLNNKHEKALDTVLATVNRVETEFHAVRHVYDTYPDNAVIRRVLSSCTGSQRHAFKYAMRVGLSIVSYPNNVFVANYLPGAECVIHEIYSELPGAWSAADCSTCRERRTRWN